MGELEKRIASSKLKQLEREKEYNLTESASQNKSSPIFFPASKQLWARENLQKVT